MKLYKHQEAGVQAFVENKFFFNLSEPGCGKTAVAIVAADRLQVRRVLVVCPSSLILNWAEEFKLWAPQRWRVVPIVGDGKRRLRSIQDGLDFAAKGGSVAMIVNYEAIQWRGKRDKRGRLSGDNLNEIANALTGRWGVVIMDEIHRAKGPKSMTRKGLKQITAMALRRWGLTGTPVPNNILDLWSPMDIVKPGIVSENFFSFRSRYCDIYTGAGFPQIRRFLNEDELKAKLDSISIRFTKAECLDLPDKINVNVPVALEPKTVKIYRQMVDELVVEIGNEVVIAQNVLTKMLRLQQITGGFLTDEDGTVHDVGTEKIDALKDLLETFEGESVVVMCRFATETRRLREALKDRNLIEITGEISREDRQAGVERFQKGSAGCVAICTIQAAGVGLTLTRASKMIFFSQNFSLSDAIQASDRVHRIGQNADKVVYYNLVCKGTIDEYILKVINKKRVLADKMTGDDVRMMAMGGEDGEEHS